MLTKLVTAAALAAALAAVSAAPATSAVAGKCLPKEIKIKGHTAIADCGSATAILRYKGATYRFKNGTCLKSAGAITLDLGTSLVGDDNLGLSHFSLTMLSTSTAPLLATSGKLTINATAKLSSRGASARSRAPTGRQGHEDQRDARERLVALRRGLRALARALDEAAADWASPSRWTSCSLATSGRQTFVAATRSGGALSKAPIVTQPQQQVHAGSRPRGPCSAWIHRLARATDSWERLGRVAAGFRPLRGLHPQRRCALRDAPTSPWRARQAADPGSDELVEAAGLRVAVVAPAHDARAVPDATAAHVVVRDLDHELGP